MVFHEIDIPGLNYNGWQHVLLLAIGMWDAGVSVGNHLTLLTLTVTDGIDKERCLLDLFSSCSDGLVCGDLR